MALLSLKVTTAVTPVGGSTPAVVAVKSVAISSPFSPQVTVPLQGQKDQANGYAGLDAGAKLKVAELPSSVGIVSSVTQGGNLGSAQSVAMAAQYQVWLVGTLNANVAVTITNLVPGGHVKLLLTQDATGGRTLSVGGQTVAINAAPNGVSEIDVFSPDGANLYVESGGPSSSPTGNWGDGSDGVVAFDGVTAYSGFSSLAGSTYTLTGPVFGTTVSVAAGVTVKVAGFPIYATVSFTNAGTVDGTGNAASGVSAGASPSGVVVYPGIPGSAGNSGNGGSPTSGGSIGVGAGGAGGAGSGHPGGAGISPTGGSTTRFFRIVPMVRIAAWSGSSASNPKTITGGVGGAAGGGDGTNAGGGGGAGGNFVAIFSPQITSSGVIQCPGGTGGTPPTGNAGGGGGGGGGTILLYSQVPWANTGTTNVLGGTAGAGVGTGSAGSPGSNGNVLNVVLV